MKLSKFRLPFFFLLGLIIVLALSLLTFYLVMNPPMGELNLMALFLGITTGISALIGLVSFRLGWFGKFPSIKISLLINYLVASFLIILNVWVTARLMFASEHDLKLAAILLAFATSIALVFGFFLSSGLTNRIEKVKKAANRIAEGDLTTRAVIDGSDEISSLASSFNHMAEQLQKAETHQKELDKLRRDLIAWLTHDLQTPLTSIRVQIEAIVDGVVSEPQDVNRYLQSTQKQVKSLSILIDDLFQIAQIDAGGIVIQPVTSSLRDLISDTLESFSAIADEKGIALTGEITEDIDPVLLDPNKINRVLNNLVRNAIQYTQKGGSVEIKAWRESNEIHIRIQDTGEGIGDEDLPFVFDRFYRGEKSRNKQLGGTGLGLAIAKGIVHAHRGTIEVNSKKSEGTEFLIHLPLD
jgi:signal transduction histidine kinase